MIDDKTTPATEIAEGLPPVPPIHADQVESESIRVNEPSAMEVFLAWEKLRILYNAVLIVVALIKARFVDDMGLASLIIGALLANLCLCSGPVVEGYLCWLGLPRPIIRPLIFCIGMFVALVLAINTRARDLAPPLH